MIGTPKSNALKTVTHYSNIVCFLKVEWVKCLYPLRKKKIKEALDKNDEKH